MLRPAEKVVYVSTIQCILRWPGPSGVMCTALMGLSKMLCLGGVLPTSSRAFLRHGVVVCHTASTIQFCEVRLRGWPWQEINKYGGRRTPVLLARHPA